MSFLFGVLVGGAIVWFWRSKLEVIFRKVKDYFNR